MYPLITLSLLQVLLTLPARAQFSEPFVDPGSIRYTEWQGETDSWVVVHSGDTFSLQTAGFARSDTIYLATPSRVAFGTWSFSFAYSDINLSNFNGARVYLVADQVDLESDIRGYFLQFGTNNSDEIRLYRQDGDASSKRVELARTTGPRLEADTQSLDITVTRTAEGLWSVQLNRETILSANDDTYTSSSYFGMWVKHTSTTSRAYTFDNIEVRFDDSRPPEILFAEQLNDIEIEVYFNEAIDPYSVEAGRFDIGGLIPESVRAVSDMQWRIVFGKKILPESEEWQLNIRSLRDIAGNELVPTHLTVAQLADSGDLVINEIMYAPRTTDQDGRPAQPEYIELYNRTATTLAANRFYRTREPDATGDADTLHFSSPLSSLAPNSFAILYADTNTASIIDRTTFASAFPDLNLSHSNITFLPVHRTSLGLRNQGDTVRIQRSDGVVLDEVTYAPSWHNPALADSRGVSLERISADAPARSAANWTSSPTSSGGTPGLPNAVSHAQAHLPGRSTLVVEPSPFSPDQDGFEDATTIHFTTPFTGGSARVRIYDSHGRLVRTLTPATLIGPNSRYEWDGLDDSGRQLRAGIYIVALDAVFPNDGVTTFHKAVVVLARSLD